MSKKIFKISLVLIALSLLLSACTLPWKKKIATDSDPLINEETVNEEISSITNNTKQIRKFASYDDLKAFLKENVNNQNYSRISDAISLSSSIQSMESGSSRDASKNISQSVSQGTTDYSSTNNQVLGVDEADIIKTDGNYIYALVHSDLKIIKVNPASDAQVVSTINFKSRPQDIFINGTSLSVFGSDQQIFTLDLYKSFRRQNPYTFFKVYDLTDLANPKLVRDLNFEGSYTDARLIDDYVYLFTNSSANYVESESSVPRVLDNGEVLASSCEASAKCFTPDVYYFDIPYDSYNFVNVNAINVKDNNEAISGQVYLMNYGQNFYVSKNNIYITYTEYLNEYELEQSVKKNLITGKLSAEDQDKIIKIEAVPGFILNKNEKEIKIASIIDNYFNTLSEEDQKTLQISIDDSLKQKLFEQSANMEKTIIHKIAISGKNIEYRGMGEVQGQVLNQFSMDEYNDYFRIATTRNEIWSRLSDKPNESHSNVYILDNELKITGSLENLATNERIYSARLMGDRVYLVTFKKTDPLYVIDLSNISQPNVLGAIKIPGFSSYLHPADKDGNKLIGFGRDTEENSDGTVKINGLKIALFDFSDLNSPKELDSYIIGNSESDSIALQDHKAFLYSEAKNILAIPAVLRDNNKISFAGSLVFSITDNRFVLKGKVDHSEGLNKSNPDPWNGYGYYDNTVKRSLYIDNSLYTFSNQFLKINSINDLSFLKRVILSGNANDYIVTPAADSNASEPASGSTPVSDPPPVSTSAPEVSVPATSSTETPTQEVNITPVSGTSTPIEPQVRDGVLVSSSTNPL